MRQVAPLWLLMIRLSPLYPPPFCSFPFASSAVQTGGNFSTVLGHIAESWHATYLLPTRGKPLCLRFSLGVGHNGRIQDLINFLVAKNLNMQCARVKQALV